VAVWNGGAQPSAAPRAAAGARHIRRRAGLVDEHQAGRIEIELPGNPIAALSQNVRALLLLGVRRLFLNVISWRSKKRHSTDDEKCPAHGAGDADPKSPRRRPLRAATIFKQINADSGIPHHDSFRSDTALRSSASRSFSPAMPTRVKSA
jgi:hypothetical protein